MKNTKTTDMTKILITENQLQTIKNQLVTEGNEDSYRREVKVSFYYPKASFKGKEINDITANESVVLLFEIDMEHRSWGVKSVSLYGIRGEQTLDIRIDYYANEDTDTEYEYVTLNLDWEKLQTEERNGEGIVTVGDTLEINLSNDENGNLVVDYMAIDTYTL
jgi:hypothetical protein